MEFPPEMGSEPASPPKSVLSWLRDRFLAGLFAVLPMVITCWLINFIYNLVNGPANRLLQAWIEEGGTPSARYFLIHYAWVVPLAGFFFTLLLILGIGIIAAHLMGQRLLRGIDGMLLRLPVIKVIYQALRQAMQAVQQIGGEKGSNQFRQVAYITLPGSEARFYGFVTGRYVDEQGVALVTVFIPTAPSLLSGFVSMVPEEKLQLAHGISVEQATKMVLSLGLITP